MSPVVRKAQMMRAVLLASATITSIRGLRASIRASQDPDGAPYLIALRTTELAPMISRRRSVRSPIFEVAPSFCLPPLERCDGVSPTQAAKSRPLLKAPAGGANAANPDFSYRSGPRAGTGAAAR